jgi:pSer/pThr/pTyr-binding forkhead associated (FHA) protein
MDAQGRLPPLEALPGAPGVGQIVLGALVYLFLLQFVWLLWRDLRGAQTSAQAMLNLLEAPPETAEAGLQPGQSFVVGSPTTLGRAPGNTVVVPAETVSSTHLRIVYRNGGWWIEDLGSTNGTFVNGRPIADVTRLAGGDVVGCGPQVRFRLLEG